MKPLAEFLYNLATLTLVAAFAFLSFWGFVALVGTSPLISLALMALERAHA